MDRIWCVFFQYPRNEAKERIHCSISHLLMDLHKYFINTNTIKWLLLPSSNCLVECRGISDWSWSDLTFARLQKAPQDSQNHVLLYQGNSSAIPIEILTLNQLHLLHQMNRLFCACRARFWSCGSSSSTSSGWSRSSSCISSSSCSQSFSVSTSSCSSSSSASCCWWRSWFSNSSSSCSQSFPASTSSCSSSSSASCCWWRSWF